MKTVLLGEVCDFRRGLTYKKTDEVDFSDNVVLRANNVDLDTFRLNLTELKYIRNNIEVPERKKLQKDSLLICTASGSKSHLGKVAYIDKDYAYAFGGFMGLLVPKSGIDGRYIYIILTTKRFRDYMGKLTDGANINNLRFDLIKNFTFNLPEDIREQKRIVRELDEAFEKIDKAIELTQKNLQNSQDLFESSSRKVFTNINSEPVLLGSVASLMTGGTPSKSKKEYFENGSISWLVSGDINKGEIYDCEGRITEDGLKNSNARYLPVNSVMIALNGQGKTRGTVAMLRTKATCNQSLVSIYPKEINKLIPEYIYQNLRSRYEEIRKMTGDTGNERRGLNMRLIRGISIRIPKDIDDQRKIVDTLENLFEQTQRLQKLYQQKLDNLNELKQSLLKQAFEGKL